MADDIRSILENAVAKDAEATSVETAPVAVVADGQDAGVLAEPAETKDQAVDAGADDSAARPGVAEADGRRRDASGKFTKAEADKTQAPKAAKPTATVAPTAKPVTPSATAAPAPGETTPVEPPKQEYIDHKGRRIDITKPPTSFGPLVRERWAGLPKELRADLVRREVDVAQSVGPAVENRNFRETFQRAAAPYQALIQATGGDPVRHFSTLLQAEHSIYNGPIQSRAQALAGLWKNSGVPLEVLAAAIDGTPAPQTQQQHQQPAVDAGQIAAQVRQQLKQEMQQAEAQREADSLASKPHFDDIREDMALLLDHGRAKTIEEAYNRALSMHKADPDSQVGELLRQGDAETRQREQEKAAQALQASTQRAKNASSSIRGQPASAQSGGSGGTVRSALDAAIALHSGR